MLLLNIFKRYIFIILFNNNIYSQVDSLKTNTFYIEYGGESGAVSSYKTQNFISSGILSIKYDKIIYKHNNSFIDINRYYSR